MAWQAIGLRLIHQQVKRVEPTQNALVGPIELRFRRPGSLQGSDTLLRPHLELLDGPELNRLGRTGRRTDRLQPVLEPVIAQRALLRRALPGVLRTAHMDHTKGARGDTGTAAIAHGGLNEYTVKLGENDRPGGAYILT